MEAARFDFGAAGDKYAVHLNDEDSPTYFGFLNVKNGKLLVPDEDDFENGCGGGPEHEDLAYRRSKGKLNKESLICKGHIAFRGFPNGELNLSIPDTPEARTRALRLVSDLVREFDHNYICVDFVNPKNGNLTTCITAQHFSDFRRQITSSVTKFSPPTKPHNPSK